MAHPRKGAPLFLQFAAAGFVFVCPKGGRHGRIPPSKATFRRQGFRFASVPLVVIASPGNRPRGYARHVENDPLPTVSLAVEELRRLRYPDYAFAGACTDEPLF